MSPCLLKGNETDKINFGDVFIAATCNADERNATQGTMLRNAAAGTIK